MSETSYKDFRAAFEASPELEGYLDATFQSADAACLDRVMELIDEGDFTASAWIEALKRMGEWLEARELQLPLSDQIGYVSCASDAVQNAAGLEHLPDVVAEMLETYGCERATKK